MKGEARTRVVTNEVVKRFAAQSTRASAKLEGRVVPFGYVRSALGLALLAAGQPDEAAHVGIAAITSGRVVLSNWWRATEVLRGVERAAIAEAADLRDASEEHRPHG